MICKKCLKRNEDGAKFCLNCGNNLETQSPVIFCTDCFEVVDENGKFCEKCGASIVQDFTEDKMIRRKEEEAKEEIYKNALISNDGKDATIEQYQNSLNELTKIAGYKDADELSKNYSTIIKDLNKKAEDAKKRRNKKILKIGVPAVVVLTMLVSAGLMINHFVIQPKSDYKEATALFAEKNYSEARDLFIKLNKYSDSKKMVNECSYAIIGKLLSEKDFTNAQIEISRFPHSDPRYQTAKKELSYQWGLDKLANDGLFASENFFKAVGANYKDVDYYLNLIEFLKPYEGEYGIDYNPFELKFFIVDKHIIIRFSQLYYESAKIDGNIITGSDGEDLIIITTESVTMKYNGTTVTRYRNGLKQNLFN